jgi:hypothetical protein
MAAEAGNFAAARCNFTIPSAVENDDIPECRMAELKFPIPFAMLVAFSASANVAGQTSPSYPAAVQGIWFTDDADGNAQCRRYVFARSRKRGDPDMHLVGSQIISGNLWHSYSEYGEGNFYVLRSLAKIGRQHWRADAAVGIDVYPEPEDGQNATFDIQLNKGQLTLAMDPLGDTLRMASIDEPLYARCTSVPKGFYKD